MSLIEVLLAVVLMSVVVLGIAAGFQTTAKVSGDAGARAELQSALDSATDRVATLTYPGCASVTDISTAANAAHIATSGYDVAVVDVRYLVPVGACTATTSALSLTVRVTSVVDPSATVTGEVVLRNPAARPT